MIVKLIFRIINIASTRIRLSEEPFHRYGGGKKVGGMVLTENLYSYTF